MIMRTEQEKYLDALHKAHEFKKALDDLKPETRERLFRALLGVSTMQEVVTKLCEMFTNHGKL